MNKLVGTISCAALLTTAAVTLVAPAGAAPLGGSSASDAVSSLESQGYSVQLNYVSGLPDVPLKECNVTDVHGLSTTNTGDEPLTAAESGTAYLDVDCPEHG